jgi:predicted DsbA family dithiol-disulfide isomerase
MRLVLNDRHEIDRHATESGIDLAAMRAALADGSASAAVTEAETTGRNYGVQGTPAWLFGWLENNCKLRPDTLAHSSARAHG